MVTAKKLPPQSSVRWEEDLQPLVAEWFKKNPGWTISQLANQAIRKFVMNAYVTEPVEEFVSSNKLQHEGRFQLKTREDSKNFAYIQMKIENPLITQEYLSKKKS